MRAMCCSLKCWHIKLWRIIKVKCAFNIICIFFFLQPVYYGNKCFHLKNNNKKDAFVLFTCVIFSDCQLVHVLWKLHRLGRNYSNFIYIKLKLGTEKYIHLKWVFTSTMVERFHWRLTALAKIFAIKSCSNAICFAIIPWQIPIENKQTAFPFDSWK